MTADDLKQWRVTASLSQHALARLLGVSIRTVSRWETGDVIPAFLPLALETLERRAPVKPATAA